MYKVGDIITNDNLVFSNGIKDIKKDRPCIFLFSVDTEKYGTIIFSCPLTSKVNTFNKHPENYCFIPEVIYNYETLSFAKINDVFATTIEHTKKEGMTIDRKTYDILIEKIRKFNQFENDYNRYEIVHEIIDYISLFDKFDERILKKQKNIYTKK